MWRSVLCNSTVTLSSPRSSPLVQCACYAVCYCYIHTGSWRAGQAVTWSGTAQVGDAAVFVCFQTGRQIAWPPCSIRPLCSSFWCHFTRSRKRYRGVVKRPYDRQAGKVLTLVRSGGPTRRSWCKPDRSLKKDLYHLLRRCPYPPFLFLGA